ncbi:uncharacterized protein LOC111827137 [Myotis lucifugus]|uniref:uncharacterized protein LOC111827137 n=1 Tax=Myotis lucifugus TaxID=59463 RepID=UPI000CCC1CD8|nr:uncharacterized protein LOC111827137 [Myotis lucifugus]
MGLSPLTICGISRRFWKSPPKVPFLNKFPMADASKNKNNKTKENQLPKTRVTTEIQELVIIWAVVLQTRHPSVAVLESGGETAEHHLEGQTFKNIYLKAHDEQHLVIQPSPALTVKSPPGNNNSSQLLIQEQFDASQEPSASWEVSFLLLTFQHFRTSLINNRLYLLSTSVCFLPLPGQSHSTVTRHFSGNESPTPCTTSSLLNKMTEGPLNVLFSVGMFFTQYMPGSLPHFLQVSVQMWCYPICNILTNKGKK